MKKPCSKAAYYSEERAVQAIRKIHENPERFKGYLPTSSYRCNSCHQWHLTSKVQKFYIDRNTNTNRKRRRK